MKHVHVHYVNLQIILRFIFDPHTNVKLHASSNRGVDTLATVEQDLDRRKST